VALAISTDKKMLELYIKKMVNTYTRIIIIIIWEKLYSTIINIAILVNYRLHDKKQLYRERRREGRDNFESDFCLKRCKQP
jgi:hypothetical protein